MALDRLAGQPIEVGVVLRTAGPTATHMRLWHNVLTPALSKHVRCSRVHAPSTYRLIEPSAMLISVRPLLRRYAHPLDSLFAERLTQLGKQRIQLLLLGLQASYEIGPSGIRA